MTDSGVENGEQEGRSPQSRWDRYRFPPAFVLGFHGCDKLVGEAVLRGDIVHLDASENAYDWLGTGIYFWESDPHRALAFARERFVGGRNSKGSIEDPFVIGAIIDLGFCLDMRDSSSLQEVKLSYEAFYLSTLNQGHTLPQNLGQELKVRHLDCAVMNFLHAQREEQQWAAYDTVRADFWEGGELYPKAGFRELDHIQICVRNTDSILGYFRPVQ